MMYDSLTDLTDWTPEQLYRRIEAEIRDRSVYGRGRTPDAQHYRSVVNPEIRRLRKELNRRGLPSRRWLYEAQIEAEDARDLRETQQDVIYG